MNILILQFRLQSKHLKIVISSLIKKEIVNEIGLRKKEYIATILNKKVGSVDPNLSNIIYFRYIYYHKKLLNISKINKNPNLFNYCRKNNIPIGCSSSFTTELIDILIKKLDKKVIPNPFIGADSLRKGKPHPDGINEILSQLNCFENNIKRSENVIKLADTIYDVKEGVSSEYLTIGMSKYSPLIHNHINEKITSAEELVKLDLFEHGAKYVVSDDVHLIELIKSINHNEEELIL